MQGALHTPLEASPLGQ